MWRAHDERTFQLRADRTELTDTGDSLDAVASALLAGLRITSEELALIRALYVGRGAPPRLDVAGLSAVYRVVVLARALQVRIPALDLLLRLVPPDADPFRPGEPDATRRFVEIVREYAWTKPVRYWWYVQPWGDDGPKVPHGKFSSFAEARQFVRDM